MYASRILKTAIAMTFTAVAATSIAQTAPVPIPAPDSADVENINTPPPEILGESLDKITKIYGTVSESGNHQAKEPVAYDFWYNRPHSFAVQFTKPKSIARSTISFDGSTFRLVFRSTKNALVVRGLAPDQKLVRNTVLNYGEGVSYAVTSAPAEKSVAIQLGEGAAQGLSNLRVEFEKQFSFPHKLQFKADSTTYKREFTHLDFNSKKSPAPPREFIPTEAEIFDWNLNLRNVRVPGSNLDVDFWVYNPTEFGDFVMEKVVYQRYARKAMAARFKSKDGRYFIMAAHNQEHGSAIPEELGVPIKAPDGFEGRIVPGPPMNIYTFVKGDARVYFIGNASIPELISFSAKIPSKEVFESQQKKIEPGK